MKLPVTLHNEIINFFISLPNLYDTEGQRAFIYSAGLDQQLQIQFPIGKPPAQFVPLFISTLTAYGKLDDGRNALETVLEAAKNYVGPDKRVYCEKLIDEVHFNVTKCAESENIIRRQKYHKGFIAIIFLIIIMVYGIWTIHKNFSLSPEEKLKINDSIILGEFYLEREEWENALKEFEKVLAIDDSNERAREAHEKARKALIKEDL